MVIANTKYIIDGNYLGQSTNGSLTTIVDSTRNFENDMLIGKIIKITINGIDYYRKVTDNTADTITFNTLPVGEAEVDTLTITDGATADGDITVTLNGVDYGVTVLGGVNQVETATVVGTIEAAGEGNATVIVTAAGMTGSPKTISVAVANDDTAALVAGKIRTALGLDSDVIALFDISGTDENIILTAKTKAANDTSLNISIDNGTCIGLTTAATSTNTTAGVAADTAADVAGRVRATVMEGYTITGSTNGAIITADTNFVSEAPVFTDTDETGVTASFARTNEGVAPIPATANMMYILIDDISGLLSNIDYNTAT